MSDIIDSLANKLVQGDDQEIFSEYLQPHVRLIFGSAFRLTGNEGDAEDLTQETFYYALKNFYQLKDRAKCKYWLFAILRNLFLKEIERRKKRNEVYFENLEVAPDNAIGLEEDLLRTEVKEQVRTVLNKLDERLKQPLELFYFHRKSYKEIASNMDLPIGTVMSRIARGKIYLKKEIERLK